MTDRVPVTQTVEEARDDVIAWAETGVPFGTTWDAAFKVLIKSVAWLCIKQMQRDAQRERRYGR